MNPTFSIMISTTLICKQVYGAGPTFGTLGDNDQRDTDIRQSWCKYHLGIVVQEPLVAYKSTDILQIRTIIYIGWQNSYQKRLG